MVGDPTGWTSCQPGGPRLLDVQPADRSVSAYSILTGRQRWICHLSAEPVSNGLGLAEPGRDDVSGSGASGRPAGRLHEMRGLSEAIRSTRSYHRESAPPPLAFFEGAGLPLAQQVFHATRCLCVFRMLCVFTGRPKLPFRQSPRVRGNSNPVFRPAPMFQLMTGSLGPTCLMVQAHQAHSALGVARDGWMSRASVRPVRARGSRTRAHLSRVILVE